MVDRCPDQASHLIFMEEGSEVTARGEGRHVELHDMAEERGPAAAEYFRSRHEEGESGGVEAILSLEIEPASRL